MTKGFLQADAQGTQIVDLGNIIDLRRYCMPTAKYVHMSPH